MLIKAAQRKVEPDYRIHITTHKIYITTSIIQGALLSQDNST